MLKVTATLLVLLGVVLDHEAHACSHDPVEHPNDPADCFCIGWQAPRDLLVGRIELENERAFLVVEELLMESTPEVGARIDITLAYDGYYDAGSTRVLAWNNQGSIERNGETLRPYWRYVHLGPDAASMRGPFSSHDGQCSETVVTRAYLDFLATTDSVSDCRRRVYAALDVPKPPPVNYPDCDGLGCAGADVPGAGLIALALLIALRTTTGARRARAP